MLVAQDVQFAVQVPAALSLNPVRTERHVAFLADRLEGCHTQEAQGARSIWKWFGLSSSDEDAWPL